MKKRKITFLINSLSSGGAERVLTTLANNLIKTYEVSIITFIDIPPFYNIDKEVKVIPCFDKIKSSSNPIMALQSNYALFKRINHIVKENDFDLLISFMTTANVLGTIIGKLNHIPIIISERTNPYQQQLPKIWNLLRTIFYRYSDILIVQTETICNFFAGKVNKNKIRILPNPISIELTNNRSLNDLSEKKYVILSVGRLIPSKAHNILIRAYADTEYSDWELWIAGDGPEFNNLQRLIEELFAFSSTYEGFPNALIEAMHFGLACVSTDCPTGPSELIKDGENGYLIPMNDVKEMSKKLTDLMENHSKIEDFGKKSVLAVQQYEEENVVSQWKSIIECLIK